MLAPFAEREVPPEPYDLLQQLSRANGLHGTEYIDAISGLLRVIEAAAADAGRTFGPAAAESRVLNETAAYAHCALAQVAVIHANQARGSGAGRGGADLAVRTAAAAFRRRARAVSPTVCKQQCRPCPS